MDQDSQQVLYEGINADHRKGMYGGGVLISDVAAEEKERKEKERKESQYVWQLSEREKEIVKKLG